MKARNSVVEIKSLPEALAFYRKHLYYVTYANGDHDDPCSVQRLPSRLPLATGARTRRRIL